MSSFGSMVSSSSTARLAWPERAQASPTMATMFPRSFGSFCWAMSIASTSCRACSVSPRMRWIMARWARVWSATGASTLSSLMVSRVRSASRGSSWSWSCALAKTAAVSSFLKSVSSLAIASLRDSFVSAAPRTIEATRRWLRA